MCLEVRIAEGRGLLRVGRGCGRGRGGLFPGGLQMLFPGTGLCFWELQELGDQGSRDRLAGTSQNE